MNSVTASAKMDDATRNRQPLLWEVHDALPEAERSLFAETAKFEFASGLNATIEGARRVIGHPKKQKWGPYAKHWGWFLETVGTWIEAENARLLAGSEALVQRAAA